MNLGNFAAVARVAALSSLMALAAAPAMAQEVAPEHLSAAKAAVAASGSTASLDVILPSEAEKIKQQLIANRPDAADKITAIVDATAIAMASRRRDLEDEVARGYAKLFTAAELKAIGDFYNSSAGKKLIEQTPAVGRMIEQSARVWSNGIVRDLQQEVAKKLKEAGL
jgi:hypothetical protein